MKRRILPICIASLFFGMLILFNIPRYKEVTINFGGFDIVTQAKELEVEASAYYGHSLTSTGSVPIPYYTLAVDPKIIPYGTKVYIPEYGTIFIAQDCGSAIKGKKVDLYLFSKDECINFGRKNITIYVLK